MKRISLLVAALCLHSISALPLADQSDCLEKLNADLAAVAIPEDVEKLIGFIRSLNPILKDESLNELLKDPKAELDLYKAGYIKQGQDNVYVNACADYVSHIMETMRSTTCGTELIELSENDQASFDKTLEVNPSLNKVYGIARACVRIL